MTEQLLKIGLLGYPQVAIGTVVMDKFVTKRAEALFYYLAATRRPHSRDKLATLFWPEATEAKGKKNLRTALPVLRKLLGDYLTISRDFVAFDDNQSFMLDIQLLQTAVSTQNIEELQTAVSAYKGDFLEGFYVDGSPDFDDWMFAQSEQYRNLLIQGLRLLSAHYLQQRQYTDGLASTARLLDIEPWSESGYRQRMLLFAYNQQRSSALKIYEQCQRMLDETFGITPMVETIALYERIRAEGTNGKEAVSPLHNLPRDLTPFMGRTAELQQLRDNALNPRYPLITIMGEGGVGKSRFARMAASQLLYEFADGVWFVSLIDIAPASEAEEAETGLALAIANALDIQMQANIPIPEQVITFLQGKRPLLILDNMEHLIDGVDFIVRLLKEAKQTQLIVTSRRRLHLQAESILRLRGLPTPPEGAMHDEAIAHTSVQLFVERASWVEPDFALTADNVHAVGQICRLVDGLPLGIVLAAALVEQQRCAEIASAIQDGIGTLATGMRDLPEHHRTIYTLFAYSWRLLSPSAQETVAQCAVFAGGFTLEAATAIVIVATGTMEEELMALIHQSLLTRAENGRYRMHPLIQQFARQKQTELIEENHQPEAVNQRHSAYYLQTCIVDYTEIWNVPRATVQAEISNKQLAWKNALQVRNFPLLASSAASWYALCSRLSILLEGIATFTKTLKVIKAESSPVENAEWIAIMQAELVDLLIFVGRFEEAQLLAEETLALTDTPQILAQIYASQSVVMWYNGFSDKAEALLDQILALKGEASVWTYIDTLKDKATVLSLRGEYDEGMALFEEALAMADQYQYLHKKVLILNNLGEIHEFNGQPYQALQDHKLSYEIADSIEFIHGKEISLSGLASICTYLGLYEMAVVYLQEVFAISAITGVKLLHGGHLISDAHLCNSTERYDEAIEKGQKALGIFQKINSRWNMIAAYQALGSAWLGKEAWAQAEAVYKQLLAHCEELSLPEGTADPLSGLAFIAYQRGDVALMREWIERVLTVLSTITLSHESVGNLMDIYLRCYLVLDHLGDQRAVGVLQTAYDLLQERAAEIGETAVCQSFLQNVPANREIMAAMGER